MAAARATGIFHVALGPALESPVAKSLPPSATFQQQASQRDGTDPNTQQAKRQKVVKPKETTRPPSAETPRQGVVSDAPQAVHIQAPAFAVPAITEPVHNLYVGGADVDFMFADFFPELRDGEPGFSKPFVHAVFYAVLCDLRPDLLQVPYDTITPAHTSQRDQERELCTDLVQRLPAILIRIMKRGYSFAQRKAPASRDPSRVPTVTLDAIDLDCMARPYDVTSNVRTDEWDMSIPVHALERDELTRMLGQPYEFAHPYACDHGPNTIYAFELPVLAIVNALLVSQASTISALSHAATPLGRYLNDTEVQRLRPYLALYIVRFVLRSILTKLGF